MSTGTNQAVPQLPRTLAEWRTPNAPEGTELWKVEAALWDAVRPAFERINIDLWHSKPANQWARKGELKLSSGFAYLIPQRLEMWADNFKKIYHWNGLLRGATTADGHSAMVRVVAIGQEGKMHMDILRMVGQGPAILCSDNHALPLWREIHIGATVFAVSPFVGACVDQAYGGFCNDSVGDVVDMILQCLQALAYLHSVGIAHRDTDTSNFLVQWHPESLTTMRVPLVRPRVFLNDFEHAYKHTPGTTSTSVRPLADYQRPVAPEVHSGLRFDPFKPDVWQLAQGFSDFRSTIRQIDQILDAMGDPSAAIRPSASEARDKLATVIHSMAPASLLIAPVVIRNYECY